MAIPNHSNRFAIYFVMFFSSVIALCMLNFCYLVHIHFYFFCPVNKLIPLLAIFLILKSIRLILEWALHVFFVFFYDLSFFILLILTYCCICICDGKFYVSTRQSQRVPRYLVNIILNEHVRVFLGETII